MLELVPKLPFYWSFYHLGWPRMLPFSIVVSVSFRCNSRCKTCDVWRIPSDDMTVEELVKKMEAQGVRMLPVGQGRIRAVTHYHISSDDIDYALTAFSKVLK